MSQVLLLGANGGMGRRVTSLWKSEVPGVPLLLGVRRPETLKDVPTSTRVVVARLEDPASLRAAMSGVAVVINAIGPFAYDPVPLLNACAATGVHYVDLASEPDFLAAVAAWGSHETRIAVCPGASTVPGLVELTATHLAERLGAVPAALEVFLSMGSANRLTTGLLASLTLQLGVRLRGPERVVSYRQMCRRQLHGLGRRLFGRYPSPFDEAGLGLGGRRVETRFWVGLDRSWIVRALWALSFLRPRFSDRGWIALTEKARPLLGWANLVGGRKGGMRIEALAADGTVLGAVNYLAPREGLNIPALPSVWAARALLGLVQPGVRPLHTLVRFAEAEASLSAHGFEVVENVCKAGRLFVKKN